MSDVTAVLLSLDEPTAAASRASVEAQTVQPAALVEIRGIQPFHAAWNAGVARVRTPFFLQVDADMILDPVCLERLRAGMGAEVGIRVGPLRDELVGTVAGVKLFRTEALAGVAMPGSVAQDSDLAAALLARGWQTIFSARYDGPRHTFGEHRPVWTPPSVYATYYLLGARYAYRRDLAAVSWRLGRLARSGHPQAPLARIALAHGIFSGEVRDVPKAAPPATDLAELERLATGTGGPELRAPRPAGTAREVFDSFCRFGAELRRATAGAAYRRALDGLGNGVHALVAELGLAHGAAAGEAADPARAFATLGRVLPAAG